MLLQQFGWGGLGGKGVHPTEAAVCCQDGYFWAWAPLGVEHLVASPMHLFGVLLSAVVLKYLVGAVRPHPRLGTTASSV